MHIYMYPTLHAHHSAVFFFMKIQEKHKSLDLIPKISYSTVVVKTL